MAAGSQQVTWQALGGKRPCDCCGRDMKVNEIGEVRTMVAEKKTYVWCDNCRGGHDRVKAMIELATARTTPAVNVPDWWLEYDGEQ